MKLSSSVPPVWPGYVAAVASLVLSLLLLLAILMVAIVRGQDMVKQQRYEKVTGRKVVNDVDPSSRLNKELGQEAKQAVPVASSMQAQASAPISPLISASASVAAVAKGLPANPVPAKPVPKMLAEVNAHRMGALHLRLIFEAGAASLQKAHLSKMADAIRQQQVDESATWVVSVQVPATDPVYERAAYSLMLSVRSALLDQGAEEANIRLQLRHSPTPPSGYKKGEITVHAIATEVAGSKRGHP